MTSVLYWFKTGTTPQCINMYIYIYIYLFIYIYTYSRNLRSRWQCKLSTWNRKTWDDAAIRHRVHWYTASFLSAAQVFFANLLLMSQHLWALYYCFNSACFAEAQSCFMSCRRAHTTNNSSISETTATDSHISLNSGAGQQNKCSLGSSRGLGGKFKLRPRL